MPSAIAIPKGWPADIEFLTRPSYSKHIDIGHVTQTTLSSSNIASKASNNNTTIIKSSSNSEPCNSVRITPIINPSHPAHGQHGLFATRHLPPDTFVISYIGFVHGPDEADETSNYDLSLDRERGIGVDATRMGNEARFINDYRGIRDVGPNAEFRDCWVEGLTGSMRGRLEKRIGIYVLGAGKSGKRAKGIAKGEEILVSYGKGFWAHREDS